MADLVTWAESEVGWYREDGRPITLSTWQRVVLSEYWRRRYQVSTLFMSSVKKTGKTLLNSLIVTYRWLTVPNVHFVIGNDKDQSAELQVNMIGAMLKRHPFLKGAVRVTGSEIEYLKTGSRIVSLPMDARGAAGANFATCSWTELWGFVYEENERLYEELTPVPGDCLRLVDSYAGYEGESELLRRVWDRGLAGEPVRDDWPIYLTGQQLSYIHQGEDAQRRCWREGDREAYYAEQEATLRAGTFRRLHRNEWASAEDRFVEPEQWDRCVDPSHVCPAGAVPLCVGVDLGVKHDYAAAVAVQRDDGRLLLGPYRIWKPSGGEVDLSAVEDWLLRVHKRFPRSRFAADPYQAAHLMQRLGRHGVRIEEFPQTTGNLTKLGNTLFDVLKQGRLVVYAGATDLREHVLNARAKETERGVRLVKGQSSRKIDAAIALGEAVVVEEETPVLKHVRSMRRRPQIDGRRR